MLAMASLAYFFYCRGVSWFFFLTGFASMTIYYVLTSMVCIVGGSHEEFEKK